MQNCSFCVKSKGNVFYCRNISDAKYCLTHNTVSKRNRSRRLETNVFKCGCVMVGSTHDHSA